MNLVNQQLIVQWVPGGGGGGGTDGRGKYGRFVGAADKSSDRGGNRRIGTGARRNISGGMGGMARLQVLFEDHMSILYLWYRNNWIDLNAGSVLPTIQFHILCMNWHLCGICGE